jgi:glyoxylase-like metal-dependent hydrolase (beta-lactamase superfamily II)
VLIDTAWANCAELIQQAAELLDGPNARPEAILLTHDHPDHAGSALDLARRWRCPVYMHPDEFALAMARDLSVVEQYANPLDRWIVLPIMRAMGRQRAEAIIASSNLEEVARAFDPPAPLPGLAGWVCIATPGHSPGHVAFVRESDRILITGDALLTIDMESLTGILLGCLGAARPRLHLPPWYTNWNQDETRRSAAVLARVEPRVVAAGHGVPMNGSEIAQDLAAFAERYSRPAAASYHEGSVAT